MTRRQIERLQRARRALTLIDDLDLDDSSLTIDVLLRRLVGEVAAEGRGEQLVAVVRPLLDDELLAEVIAGGGQGNARERARRRAAAALAELCVVLVDSSGREFDLDGVAAAVVDAVVALVNEAGDYGRERATATLGALLDVALLDDLVWDDHDGEVTR